MDRIENLSAHVDLLQLLDNLEKIVATPENVEDLPPEFCTYRDEGCELAPSCLECPLPQCVLDNKLISMNRAERDPEIRRLYSQNQLSLSALAALFGVSKSTVKRALKNERQD